MRISKGRVHVIGCRNKFCIYQIFLNINSVTPQIWWFRQPAEFLWILGDSIPYCCISFIRIYIFTKNRAEFPLFGKLYQTYNL